MRYCERGCGRPVRRGGECGHCARRKQDSERAIIVERDTLTRELLMMGCGVVYDHAIPMPDDAVQAYADQVADVPLSELRRLAEALRAVHAVIGPYRAHVRAVADAWESLKP